MNFTSYPGNAGWTLDRDKELTPWLERGFQPGRVMAQSHHTYTLLTSSGSVLAKVSGALEYRAVGPEDFPVIGDWVLFEPHGDQGTIQDILSRTSVLKRRTPMTRAGFGYQVLAANLDLGIIVMALDQDYSPRRVDRYLTLLKEAGAQALVWLNKADLFPIQAQSFQKDLDARWEGVHVLSGCAQSEESVQKLSPWLIPGKTLCLIGSSGAGKSTLFNALAGEKVRAVQDVRSGDGKGRHTSVDRLLHLLPGGALIMDHPGLREVGLWASEESLDEGFSQIQALAQYCRFGDCTHTGEPGCRINEALEEGTLETELWESYLRQQSEIRALARRTDPELQRQDREKWKAISKAIKSIKKGR